jgi:uncharacterized protein (DUF362 family)
MKECDSGVTVDPFIVRCLAEWLLQNYPIESVVVAEADATELNADLAFRALGWEEMFRSLPQVKLLNLTKDEKVGIKLDGLLFKELSMSRSYMESDFLISVAKLKTHCFCKMSCILKNQFGSLPRKNKAVFHKHLNEAICDLNEVRIPDLCIVDGIVGVEEDGPIGGIPKLVGILIAGNDPVATDHACARIMGIDPNRIPYLNLAIRRKLGNTQYETFGEGVDDVRTKFRCGQPLPKKMVSRAARTIIDVLARVDMYSVTQFISAGKWRRQT